MIWFLKGFLLVVGLVCLFVILNEYWKKSVLRSNEYRLSVLSKENPDPNDVDTTHFSGGWIAAMYSLNARSPREAAKYIKEMEKSLGSGK